MSFNSVLQKFVSSRHNWLLHPNRSSDWDGEPGGVGRWRKDLGNRQCSDGAVNHRVADRCKEEVAKSPLHVWHHHIGLVGHLYLLWRSWIRRPGTVEMNDRTLLRGLIKDLEVTVLGHWSNINLILFSWLDVRYICFFVKTYRIDNESRERKYCTFV